MKKIRILLLFFIIAGLAGSIANYIGTKNSSYEKYLSGEYYFIYDARTFVPGDPNYIMTPDDPMFYADYSDPRNMLMINSLDCKVYNAHDGVCTVLYGESVIEDFPLARIKVSDEDSAYFYGTKQYTYEEYIAKLDNAAKDQLSSRYMASYKSLFKSTLVITGFDVLIFAVLFLIRSHDDGTVTDIILLAGAGCSILFDVVLFYAY